jgi:hypothetical protein
MPKLSKLQIADMRRAQAHDPVLMTRKAAALRCNVTERSVDRAARLGQLQMIKIGGRAMITIASVEALLAGKQS